MRKPAAQVVGGLSWRRRGVGVWAFKLCKISVVIL
jgi:hypothetical protein